MTRRPPDKEIIELFFSRDEKALELVYYKYGGLIRSAAQRVLRDRRDAEECSNDVLRALWDSIPPNRPDSLKSYAAGVAKKTALARLRSLKAQKRSADSVSIEELEEMIPGENTVDGSVEADEIARVIEAFVLTLGERDRKAFVWRYMRAEPLARIAEKLGVSESSVKSSLHRSRKKLKKQLEKEQIWI
ncbi:MAG: sigma-70 family RNA polymerase sigma factor [Clostridia bacterium]|nr:sigma-70 family RNA polymerase sigma factor [Clostridia bacterium]